MAICKCCCLPFCGWLVRCEPCFRGLEDCSVAFAFPGHMLTVSMSGKKNGHLPRGGVHKSAISRGHSESWFCRPAGPVTHQGLGVPGARPRQEGLPRSYETMGRCRVYVRQTDGFWGRSNGTYHLLIGSVAWSLAYPFAGASGVHILAVRFLVSESRDRG